MTANRLSTASLPPPLTVPPPDAWNMAVAGLPGLQTLLQPSTDTLIIGDDGKPLLYERIGRKWWTAPNAVTSASPGPALSAAAEGGRYAAAFNNTADNAFRSPADFELPQIGTIGLVVELDDYTVPQRIFSRTSTGGSALAIDLTADGKIEAKGGVDFGTSFAISETLTDYAGRLLILFSYSWIVGTGCKISTNGVLGTSNADRNFTNAGAVDLGNELKDGSKIHACFVLADDIHAPANDAVRAAFVVSTGQAFSTPFTIEWDFTDLAIERRLFDLDAATVADGAVTAITDSLAGAEFVEATNTPSKAAADYNGKPSITFVAAGSDRLRELTMPATIPFGTDGCEQFVVMEDTSTDPADDVDYYICMYGNQGTGNARSFRRISDGTKSYLRLTTWATSTNIDGPGEDSAGKHILDGRWDDAKSDFWITGSYIGQAATAFNTPQAFMMLGCSPTTSNFAEMKWARWMIFKPDLTQDERDLVTGKLAFLYGLQPGLPDGHPYKRATFV